MNALGELLVGQQPAVHLAASRRARPSGRRPATSDRCSSCSGRCGRRRGGPARPGDPRRRGRARSSTGTRTSSYFTSQWSLSSRPHTPMPRTMFTPLVSVGTMICTIGPAARIGRVRSSCTRHMTMKKSASMPFEVNHLWPLITQSSPSRTALVSSERGSEPGLCGSVIEKPGLHRPVDERQQPLLLLLLGAVLHEDRLVARVRGHHAEQRRGADARRRAPRSCRRGPGSRGPCRRTPGAGAAPTARPASPSP